MATLGPRALLDHVTPTGVSSDYIYNWERQDGLTAGEVIAMAATEIGEANQRIASRYAGLFYQTRELFAWYESDTGETGIPMTPEHTEFKDPDGDRAADQGHMYRLKRYKDALSWDSDYLRSASRQRIMYDLRRVARKWENRVDYDFLSRMLRDDEHAVGSSGWSPGWAVGTGGNVPFIPVPYRGHKFDSTHTHFKRYNATVTADNVRTALLDAAKNLSEHGHHLANTPKTAFVSYADIETYASMTGFTSLEAPGVEVVTGGSSVVRTVVGVTTGMPGEVFGFIHTLYGYVELRWHERIPTGYGCMVQTRGAEDLENPMAIRFDEFRNSGFGLIADPQVDRSINPKLDSITFIAQHGVNVADRTAGVTWQIESGGTTYENPVIDSDEQTESASS
jgi:hypothetical protein